MARIETATGPTTDLWPDKPPGIRLVVAAYRHDPPYPGKVAHQYIDGAGHGGGLPEGAPPFGRCGIAVTDSVSPGIALDGIRGNSLFE